ncbi:TraB/GumN family protein [Rhodoferax sp.]|uniref:TraB/GumN family protein n=1 Tax=Rhodoferax sp. TaxID=50421 RepID=UPI0025D59F64|nr:TraB/GumN family protein [Rhodoferax sp.]
MNARYLWRTFQQWMLCCCLLGFCISASATGENCPPERKSLSAELFAASQAQARDRGFLWRVTKDGHSSYLYGTLHVGRETWLAAGPAMAAALQDATTLALELNPLDADNVRRMGAALAQAPVRPLAPGQRQRLERQLQAQCLPIQAVGLSPAELLLSGVALALARRDGLDAQFGSETFLALFAQQRGMPVVSLETVELQLQALLSPDAAEARQMLEDGLRELEAGTARQSLLELVSMWEHGDQQRLDTYEQWCECLVTPSEKLQMQRLLDQRNPAMAHQIDALHRSGQRVFAAVGSLHMSGDRGLPAVLGRMGYRVQRLP